MKDFENISDLIDFVLKTCSKMDGNYNKHSNYIELYLDESQNVNLERISYLNTLLKNFNSKILFLSLVNCDLKDEDLESLNMIEDLESVDISYNNIKKFPQLPENCTEIYIDDTQLEDFDIEDLDYNLTIYINKVELNSFNFILNALYFLDSGNGCPVIFENITKEDVDEIIGEYDISDEKYNELGAILLWRNKFITSDFFAKWMGIVYENDSFYLVFDDFEDILGDDKYKTEAKILSGEIWDIWQSYDTYDANPEQHFRDFDERTLNDIIKYCIENEFSFEYKDKKYICTKDNMSIKDNTIYIDDVKITGDERWESDKIIKQMGDLFRILNHSVIEAQESADQDEAYEKVKDEFEDKFGKFEHKNNKIYIKFDSWSEVIDELVWRYKQNDVINFSEMYYGGLKYILSEIDYFKMGKPDLDNLYGSIDKTTLNEIVRDRLWE